MIGPATQFSRRRLLSLTATTVGGMALLTSRIGSAASPPLHSDAEWKRLLSPMAYAVLRQGATERPYSSPLLKEHGKGRFLCAGCAQAVFSSATKFESGTGWPSFWAPLPNGVTTRTDRSMGMIRKEVRCARCDGHLGHVFSDGPRPTGLRYCMNGAALAFQPA